MLGGEQSGHIVMCDYLSTGDGIFAALRSMETIIKTGNFKMETFEKYPQLMINIPIAEKKDLHSGPLSDIITLYKQKLNNGRIIVRYSGTQNVLRVMVEADNIQVTKKVCVNLSNELKQELNV